MKIEIITVYLGKILRYNLFYGYLFRDRIDIFIFITSISIVHIFHYVINILN